MTPAPTNTQKTQKNWRLTDTCIKLLARLAHNRGISEAAMIELLVREAWEKEGEGAKVGAERSRSR